MVTDQSTTGPLADGGLPNWLKPYLNVTQLKEIESAVALAEKTTSGEIVPVIVRRCADVVPPATLISLVFVLLFTLCAEVWLASWFAYQDLWVIVMGMGMALVLGYYLADVFLPRRFWVKRRDARALAHLRAEVEFYRAGISGTKGNTGILLFLAIEERQAVVLADKAISEKLPNETWDQVLRLMVDGLRAGQCARGMINAIAQCGKLLAANFPINPADTNELPNRVRVLS